MGRKASYDTKPKKGPGRKARKQPAPLFPTDGKEDEDKQLSRRQKVRAKKRTLKQSKENELAAKKQKKEVDEKQGVLEFESDSENEETSDVPNKKMPLPTPKSNMKIFGESDEEEEEEEESEKEDTDDFGEGIDSDDDSDEGDIIKQSKKLEKKKKAEIEAGDAYMDESAKKLEVDIPSLEEVEEELKGEVDMPSIHARIKDTVFVLADFSKRREPGRSRKEYLTILLKDLAMYYSYNEFLIEKLSDMFSPGELVEFLEASELPRPVTIRTNTLKTRRKALAAALIARGVDVDVIGWSKVGLVVMRTTGNVTLGATTEYLAGHYIIQGASSFLPVMALAPKEGEKVLDMCAAPGGKTTHISAIMRNSGMVVCNDLHRDRVKALVGNLHRMGITNATITSKDGRGFPKMMPQFFDRVLLDAPCSGTGVISKDPSVKTRKDPKDIQRCAHLQKELLLAAIDSTHKFDGKNGYIVYSTCSVLIEENEEVIEYALKKRNVKLVPTGLDVGKPGYVNYREKRFNPLMNLCKRMYPHTLNVDGFFLAKLKKLGNEIKGSAEEESGS